MPTPDMEMGKSAAGSSRESSNLACLVKRAADVPWPSPRALPTLLALSDLLFVQLLPGTL